METSEAHMDSIEYIPQSPSTWAVGEMSSSRHCFPSVPKGCLQSVGILQQVQVHHVHTQSGMQ